MGTFFASRRNQVLSALVAVIFVVLAAYFLGQAQRKKVDISSTGAATVSPSPSASLTPDVSPSPSDVPSPSPSPVASVAPSVAPSSAPPASPIVTGPALTTAGQRLQSPSGDQTYANAGPCDSWTDATWTKVDCNLFTISSQTPQGSVGYMVENKSISGRTAWRVTLLTNPDGSMWHVKLAADDVSTPTFDLIDVKEAHIPGDSQPELVVGYRVSGSGQILDYDIVVLSGAGTLHGAGSRSLDHGSAIVDSTSLVDYSPKPNFSAPSYFDRNVIGFSGGAFRIVDDSHAPERPPGNLAHTASSP